MTYFGYKHWTLEEVPRCFNVGKGVLKRPASPWSRNHKWHAIVKCYGIRVEICIGPTTHEEACAWEIEWIAKENTFSTNHSHHDLHDIGCNFTRGGEGTVGRCRSPEERERIRQTLLGKKHTSQRRTNISLSRRGKSNPKISLILKGRPAHNKGKKTGKLAWNRKKAD